MVASEGHPGVLRCTSSTEDGRTVLALQGDIDLDTVALLDTWLEGARAEGGPVIVDLSGVDLLGSSGVASLLRANRHGSIVVRRPSELVRKVLDLSGVADLLESEPEE